MPEVSHVESDLHCIRCGHNLRTLAWNAKCAECGTPVEQSRVSNHLNVSDLQSLRWLRFALSFLAVTWVIDASSTVYFQLVVNYWTATGPPYVDFGFGMIQTVLWWSAIATGASAICGLIVVAVRVPIRRAWVMFVVLTNIAALIGFVIHYAIRLRVLVLSPSAETLRQDLLYVSSVLETLAPLFVFVWISGVILVGVDVRRMRILRLGLFASCVHAALGTLAGPMPLSTLTGGYEVWSQLAYWSVFAMALVCAAVCLLLLRREIPRVGARS